jgi:iron complex transport system ATP-binding protein
MIEFKDLCFSYNKEKQVLDNISGVFTKGKVTSILGRNGSGKSTLLKNVNGLLKPSSGEVFIDGRSIHDLTASDIAKEIGFLSQRSEGIDATVIDAVLTGRKPHIRFGIGESDRQVVRNVIRLMGLAELACRKTTEISGGELQKVVIARALVQEPKILLLDEPVNHLDIVNQLEVLGMIRDITLEQGITSVIVMHDINIAIRFSDELIFMKDGQIIAKCTPYDISEAVIKETFGINVKLFNDSDRIVIVPN